MKFLCCVMSPTKREVVFVLLFPQFEPKGNSSFHFYKTYTMQCFVEYVGRNEVANFIKEAV